MRYLRYNIASILGAIVCVAVGFAALREADDLWDSGLFSLTVGLLMVAVLLAVHRTGARRAFWIGFALFGWSYLSLSLIPSIDSRLITTKARAYLDQANIFFSRANAIRALLDPTACARQASALSGKCTDK
jgi:di/tricarboxylate transporter